MSDILNKLNEQKDEPQVSSDWAEWWEPEDAGEQLIGVIVEMHSAPEQYTNDGDVPDPIYTVVSVGWGDFTAGECRSTKTHVRLRAGLEDAGLDDLVLLEYKGLEKTDGGHAANTYETSVLGEDEWQEMDDADEVEGVLEG